MALRAAILRHIRVPVQTLAATRSKPQPQWSLRASLRLFSSHDDHLTKEEVIDRVLDVVKSFPKVDPSKVKFNSLYITSIFFQFPFFACQPIIDSCILLVGS